MILKRLVWQNLFTPELGRYQLGIDLVPVLPRDVPPDRVVPREGSMTIGAGHTDTLVPLSYVCS